MVRLAAATTVPGQWRAAFAVPEGAVDAFQAVFAESFTAVAAFEGGEGEGWTVEAYSPVRPDETDLAVRLALVAETQGLAAPPLTVEAIPPTDWLLATHQAFPPLRVGRFFVHGSHVEGGVPPGALPLRIDAATAFGSGEHPTTAGCLLALADLARRRRVGRALDMGCGTGILAFAAARLWRCPVLAVDVDHEAVRVARLNARVNGVADRVRVAVSDGYRGRVVRAGGPYDLVTANILARPLAGMAADLARHLAPGGAAVLSGLLARQAPLVLAAHRRLGFTLLRRWPIGVWQTLALAAPGRAPQDQD